MFFLMRVGELDDRSSLHTLVIKKAGKIEDRSRRTAVRHSPRRLQQTHGLRARFSDQPTHPADPGLPYFPDRATYHKARLGRPRGPGETLTPQKAHFNPPVLS